MAAHKPLRQHAFWLYGVLVGLAIKAGLEGALPHIIQFNNLAEVLTQQQLARPEAQYGFYPDLVRLILLLILIVRFYLGAAYFFGDIYPDKEPSAEPTSEQTGAETNDEKTNYALDFISGFAHFLAFVILGLTIDVHTTRVSWFPVVLCFILLYDALWWVFSLPYNKTRRIIKWWAIVNAVNVGASLVIFLALLIFGVSNINAELWAYSMVLFVSAYDIGAMLKGRPYFQSIKQQLAE